MAIFDKKTKSSMINYINSRLLTCQHLLCALLATSIFALRWANCLPFSGYMPTLENSDWLSFAGTYLIYAKESFGFPIGLVGGLSFPFEAANISRGSIPLFAILFKGLAQFYPPFSEFYYFIFVEMLSVFLVAYVTCLLLNILNVNSFWLKLLGTVLVALSFPLLFRSSNYYGITFIVASFPMYLLGAYFYIRIYKKPDLKSLFLFSLVFPLAALIDYYLLFGLFFLVFLCLCFNGFEMLFNHNQFNRRRVFFVASSVFLGLLISSQILLFLGNQKNLAEPPDRSSIFNGRYLSSWGYGGGSGGGFHVADVLGLIVPPNDNKKEIPPYLTLGPTTYLTKLGWPITTNDLQGGQYEGFVFLGTIPISILLFLIITKVVTLLYKFKEYFAQLRMRWIAKLFMYDEIFSLPVIVGLSTFLLYIYSLGYIIHVGGVRFNNFITPSLALAFLWPKLIFARSLGRLAIPFMLFIVIGMIVCLNKYLHRNKCCSDKLKKRLYIAVIISLTLAHIYEIRGYLKPPQAVVYGNDITNVFNRSDHLAIKELMQSRKAIILVPALRDNIGWTKIGYALAFYSNIPISGATVEFGELQEQLDQYRRDISDVLSGGIKEIIDRYGNVAIAAPPLIAKSIAAASRVPITMYKLENPEVVILIPDIKS